MNRVIVTLFAVVSLSAAANASVLDFEGFSAGTIMDTEYSGLGVSISAMNFGGGPDLAVVFDSNNPTGGDTDLGAPFSNPTLGSASPGNLLILQEHNDCDAFTCVTPDDEASRPAGQFIIAFDQGILLQSIDFFDVESDEASLSNAIELYDDENNLITMAFVPDTGGDNMWDRETFNIAGVKTIVINMGGSGAIDNIAFDTTVVPIPPALPLFVAALASMGFTRRR
ncbi:MAG: thrombospondin type 3 repeat:Cna B-type [Gammaproteobacteria bacterium]|nr:thrombospondin type 3 repeat:Cna B-type [Gammaproteobacteria bacterium]MDH3767571.1 thrombospondin type 3 repeat:Cna B-type [Gammaproteobacteria bacterium]